MTNIQLNKKLNELISNWNTTVVQERIVPIDVLRKKSKACCHFTKYKIYLPKSNLSYSIRTSEWYDTRLTDKEALLITPSRDRFSLDLIDAIEEIGRADRIPNGDTREWLFELPLSTYGGWLLIKP